MEQIKAGGLTWVGHVSNAAYNLTVAGQCRTCTGFAIGPSHPGEEAP